MPIGKPEKELKIPAPTAPVGPKAKGLPKAKKPPVKETGTPTTKMGIEGTISVPVKMIRIPKVRARGSMKEETLDELEKSVRTFGVIEPIVLRRVRDGYELVAGERRLSAAKSAGLENIPSVIYQLDEADTPLASIIENVQREDADPVSLANAIQAVVKAGKYNETQLAQKLGKSKSWVSQKLRLLQLTPKVWKFLQSGQLSEEQALPLLEFPKAEMIDEFSDLVVENRWNRDLVRSYVRQVLAGRPMRPEAMVPPEIPSHAPTTEICPMCGKSKPYGDVIPRTSMCATCWDLTREAFETAKKGG